MERLACFLAAAVMLAAGCGGKGGGYDKDAPYGTHTKTTAWEYAAKLLDQSTRTFTGAIEDGGTIGGKSFTKLALASPQGTADFLFAPYPIDAEGGTVTFGGFTNSAGVSITPDPPLELDGDPAVGAPVSIDADFTATLPQMTAPASFHATGSYTLVDTNASVVTPMGTVHGCRRYSGQGDVTGTSLPAFLQGIDLAADVWYHDSLGIVKYEVPALGVGGDMRGTWDLGDCAGGSFCAIRKSAVIAAGSPSFELDTYDISNEFDADKNTHAKMLLELRWADEARAKTGPAPAYPAVNVEFGTAMGYFPSTLTESPVSIFHPEENGKGYKFWFAFVDQAAKNEPGDAGIAYHVQVTADTDITPALRATARIYYKKLAP